MPDREPTIGERLEAAQRSLDETRRIRERARPFMDAIRESNRAHREAERRANLRLVKDDDHA